jgi:hypothetical protein
MSRMAVTRLARAVAALEEVEADRRARAWAMAIDRWLARLTTVWFGAVPIASDEDRDAARVDLDAARELGMVYYEEGASGLRAHLARLTVVGPDGVPVTGLPAAAVARVLAWTARTWPPGSRHPCDPDLPAHQRPGALDPDPPSAAFIVACRTRAAFYTHAPDTPRPTWPDTPAGTFANLCLLFVLQGEGDAGRQAVAAWLMAEADFDRARAEEQATALAEDIATLREVAAREGPAARATAMAWWPELTEEEARLVLSCSGIAAETDEAGETAAASETTPRTATRRADRPQTPAAVPSSSTPAAPPRPPPPLPPTLSPEPVRPMARLERRLGMRERLERRYGPPEESPRRELDGWTILERLARR